MRKCFAPAVGKEVAVLDELRQLFGACLAEQQVAVVSAIGSAGTWAMPAVYRASGLEVDVLLPRWAEVAYYLEQDPRVLLVILLASGSRLRWLEYRGAGQLLAASERSDMAGFPPDSVAPATDPQLHVVFRVKPTRIDLIDESRGWGCRETLDC